MNSHVDIVLNPMVYYIVPHMGVNFQPICSKGIQDVDVDFSIHVTFGI